MNPEYTGILISFILYLVMMLFIGWFFYNRTKNLSDYILGGRKLNSWVTSMSAQASDMSGWLLLGLPGYAYAAGMEAAWIALGLLTGTYINWKFIAKRLRKYTETAGNSITLPDYFENRFKTRTKALRFVSAIIIITFFLIYTASGFVAGAKLFKSVFELSYFWALSIGVFVIIAYTFLGGFMAVSWTDLIQGTIMFFAIMIVPAIGIFELGGTGSTIAAVENGNPHFLELFTDRSGESLSVIAIVSLLAWGLGYFGQPHILARFMAISHSGLIRRARKIAMVWVTVCLAAAVVLGIVGSLLVTPPLEGAAAETVFMHLVDQLVNPLFAGALLAAILAAIMSTADSQLLVTSSALTEDLYRYLVRKKASQTELVWVSRFAVIAVAVVAFYIALDPQAMVLDLVAYAWAGFGAAFGPVIFVSLYWRKMTSAGAIAGIVAGGVTVVVWKQLQGGIFELYEIVPGFILSLIAIYVFSKFGKPPLKEVEEEFDSVDSADV